MRRPKRKQRRADQRDGRTEERILHAAHAVFLKRGTAGARMQEIAAEAGVNQALLHYYFRSKDRLARAAFERAAGQLLPAVIRVLASDASLEDKVERIVDLEIGHLSKAPYLPGYIISEITHHPARVPDLIAALTGMSADDVHLHIATVLQAQIDDGVRTGALRPITPEDFIVNLMSLCIFPFAARPMISALLAMNGRAFEQFIRRRRHSLTAFFLGALRP
jgi:TetR/AcrR family transcriptional regulator